MENKIHIRTCRYCGKEIKSLYKNQSDYNLKAHELSCKDNPKNKRRKKE